MSDKTISQLPDGGSIQAADKFLISRNGYNFSVTGSGITTALTGIAGLIANSVAQESEITALQLTVANVVANAVSQEAEITAIQTANTNLWANAVAQQALIGGLATTITGIQTSLTTSNGSVSALQANVANTQSSITGLQANAAAQDAAISATNSNVAAVQANVSTLQGSVALLQSNAVVQESEISVLQSTSTSLLANAVAQQANIANLGAVVSGLQNNSATTASVAAVQANVSTLQSGVSMLQANAVSQESEIWVLQLNAVVQQATLSNLTTAVSVLQSSAANTATSTAVSALQSNVALLQSNAAAQESEIAVLQVANTALWANAGSQQAALSTVSTTVAAVQSNVSTLQNNISTLQANAVAQESEIATLQSTIAGAASASSVSAVQANVTAVQSAVSALQSNAVAQESEISTLQSTVSNLQANAVAQESEILVLQVANAALWSNAGTQQATIGGIQANLAALGQSTLSALDAQQTALNLLAPKASPNFTGFGTFINNDAQLLLAPSANTALTWRINSYQDGNLYFQSGNAQAYTGNPMYLDRSGNLSLGGSINAATGSFSTRPTFAGATPWDSANLNPKLITGDISNSTTTALQANAVALPTSTLLGTRIDPRFFRQPGDADWTAALQAATNLAVATGKTLYIPGGTLFLISNTINITGGVISIQGDGESSSVVVATHNGPIFKWQIATNTQDRFAVEGFTLRGQYSSNMDYSATAGFQFIGDNQSYFQYGRFSDLAFQSLYTAFDISKDTQVTAFGSEAMVAWNSFDRITIQGGSRAAMFGWAYHYGSGTGTTYSNIRAHIGGSGTNENGAAVLRFDAGVVGDIIVSGCHFGGSGTNNCVIAVGSSTSYRNNIAIVGCQLDAGMVYAFNLPANAPTFQRIVYAGNNTGGGVVVGANLPVLANSRIEDQLVSENRSGNVKSIAATSSAQSVSLFVITLDSASQYNGTSCEITVSGLIGGLAGGVTKMRYVIGNNGNSLSVVADGNQVSSNSVAGFFSIGASISGTTVTIYTTFTPKGGATNIDAQICCVGGIVAVRAV